MAKDLKKLYRRTKGKAVLFDHREPRTGRIRKGNRRGAYLRALKRFAPPSRRRRTAVPSELIS